MIIAQVAADPATTANDLLGAWWPIIAMVVTPVLTSFLTKEQAEKYVKQGTAVFFTIVFVILSIIQDGLDSIDPETIITRLAVYSAAAETFYRGASAVTYRTTGKSMNSVGVFAPDTGIGRPTQIN